MAQADEPKSMRNYIAPFKGIIQEKVTTSSFVVILESINMTLQTYVMRVDLYEASDLFIPHSTKQITFELLWGTFKVLSFSS